MVSILFPVCSGLGFSIWCFEFCVFEDFVVLVVLSFSSRV